MPRLFLLLVVSLTLITGLSAQGPSIPNQIAPLWKQAMAQPNDIGIACMPLYRQGQTVLYNASPFPLASVSKLLIFIEYAIRVDSGTIPLDEMVAVTSLEEYNLLRTDRGAHDRFMATYPAGVAALPLWDVAVEGMMQYSSNAAADYVLARLSPVDWQGLYARLGIYGTTIPMPLTAIPLLMNNHVDGRATMETVDSLSMALGQYYLNLYVSDFAWRQAEIDYRSQGTGEGRSTWRNWPDWDVQAAILQNDTTTGGVNDFRNIMNAIYGTTSPLTPNAQYIVRSGLRWENNEFINSNYIEYGSKLGFYSGGTLTLVGYGQPINGEPVIGVVFLRNIPQQTYRDLLREDSIGDFVHWMNMNACNGLSDLISDTLIQR